MTSLLLLHGLFPCWLEIQPILVLLPYIGTVVLMARALWMRVRRWW